jgi:hypothetical protein
MALSHRYTIQKANPMKTADKVRIRMYRQGLGDCFLLTFYDVEGANFNLLVDCGVLSTSNEFKDKMIKVAEDIKKVTDNQLDIVIGTHEHWDHVSGFEQARSVFEKMKIKKIWLAWTENEKDDFAKELKESINKKVKTVETAFARLKAQPLDHFNDKQKDGHVAYLGAFSNFFSFFGMDADDTVQGLSKTGAAMDFLRKHKKAEKEFFTPGSEQVVEMEELPGVRFYILGPPKDLKALRKMNPSKKDSEIYGMAAGLGLENSLASAFDSTAQDKYKPFDPEFTMDNLEAANAYSSYFNNDDDWRKIDDDWLYSAGNLAIALDNGINNTCLAFAIELVKSGKVLLFPGDAQIGNWMSWYNYQWTVANGDKKETVTVEDLLRRVAFYKVGHHGSHNATLKEKGLEKMIDKDLIAMIPVKKEMAVKKGWKMPFGPLLKALNEKAAGKVIIMDEPYPKIIKAKNKPKGGETELYYDLVVTN